LCSVGQRWASQEGEHLSLIHWYDRGEDVVMSEQVQAIVEAVRSLTNEQRRELMEALATVESSRTPVSAGRRELVQAIQGKYRNVPTSSESFMSRKREDLALETQS
jgi:hypothetical protein